MPRSPDSFPATLARTLNVLVWIICGSRASFWWLPKLLGEEQQLYWQDGLIAWAFLGIWVFNHLPRIGSRHFFKENRFLKTEPGLLVAIGCLFTVGLAV